MHRRFKRRLAALDPRREGEELLAALAILRETGEAPPTRAGDRAAELWASICRDEKNDMMRLLSFQLRATGMPLAEVLHSDEDGGAHRPGRTNRGCTIASCGPGSS